MAFDTLKEVGKPAEITSLNFEQFNAVNRLRHIKDSAPETWEKVCNCVVPFADAARIEPLYAPEKEHLIEQGVLTQDGAVDQNVQDYIRSGLTDITLTELFKLRDDLVEQADGSFALKADIDAVEEEFANDNDEPVEAAAAAM